MNSATAAVEVDVAVDQREEREIGALADALSGMELCADLPDEDIARPYFLPAEPLDAAALCIGIASVSAGTLSFFMCHNITMIEPGRF